VNVSEMARSLWLAVDPVTALGLPLPHPGQQTVIKGPRRFNVIAAGRRWGKNTLAEGQIIQPALSGKPVAWFSPTYKTLAEDWRRLSEILRPVIRDKSEQEQRMELVTAGVGRSDCRGCARSRCSSRLLLLVSDR
jgi:hypothetical protein